MQKLPYEQETKSVAVNKSKFDIFRLWLKKQRKTFSKWVREKIDEEIEKNDLDKKRKK